MEKCRLCGGISEVSTGFCIRCEKIVAEAQNDWALEFAAEDNIV